MSSKKLKIVVICAFILIASVSVWKFIIHRSFQIKIIDTKTNTPIQGVIANISHEFFLEIDPNYVITRVTSNSQGLINFTLPRTEDISEVTFYKDGYYLNQCNFFPTANSFKCSDRIYLNPVQNPVTNMLFPSISISSSDTYSTGGQVFRNWKAIKIRDANVYPGNQKDFQMTFSNASKDPNNPFFEVTNISFYDKGGIQPAGDECNSNGFINIMKAPDEGYTQSADIKWGCYVFRTADGRHYGKLIYTVDFSFSVFVNPNEDDRNLEYEIPLGCYLYPPGDPHVSTIFLSAGCLKK